MSPSAKAARKLQVCTNHHFCHINTANIKNAFEACGNLVLVLLVQASPRFPESQQFGELIWFLEFRKTPLRTFLAFSPNQISKLYLIGKPVLYIHATRPPLPFLPVWKDWVMTLTGAHRFNCGELILVLWKLVVTDGIHWRKHWPVCMAKEWCNDIDSFFVILARWTSSSTPAPIYSVHICIHFSEGWNFGFTLKIVLFLITFCKTCSSQEATAHGMKSVWIELCEVSSKNEIDFHMPGESWRLPFKSPSLANMFVQKWPHHKDCS